MIEAPHTPDRKVDELDNLFPGDRRVDLRIRRVLRVEGILSLRAIAAEREEFFFRIPDLGERSVSVMREVLAQRGLSFALAPGPLERGHKHAARRNTMKPPSSHLPRKL